MSDLQNHKLISKMVESHFATFLFRGAVGILLSLLVTIAGWQLRTVLQDHEIVDGLGGTIQDLRDAVKDLAKSIDNNKTTELADTRALTTQLGTLTDTVGTLAQKVSDDHDQTVANFQSLDDRMRRLSEKVQGMFTAISTLQMKVGLPVSPASAPEQ